MAYDEVGGCRYLSGFFHGECPIRETGRQSYANKGRKVCPFLGITMLFFVCVKQFFCEPRIVLRFLGFIYGTG